MIDFQDLDENTLAKVIDFSILPKQTTEAEIRESCAVTRQYGFAAFYASSAYWAPVVREELAGMEDVEIGTGIAFPFGSVPAAVKKTSASSPSNAKRMNRPSARLVWSDIILPSSRVGSCPASRP